MVPVFLTTGPVSKVRSASSDYTVDFHEFPRSDCRLSSTQKQKKTIARQRLKIRHSCIDVSCEWTAKINEILTQLEFPSWPIATRGSPCLQDGSMKFWLTFNFFYTIYIYTIYTIQHKL